MSGFNWIRDEELKEAFQSILSGAQPDAPAARNALDALREETDVNLRRHLSNSFCEKNFPTNRHGNAWAPGNPIGLVDHYTADQGVTGTLIWFSSQPRDTPGNSSAHAVIDHDGTIFVLVDPLTTVAWHATIANKDHVGIEHVNCGTLEQLADQSFKCLSGVYAVKANPPELINFKFWDPFDVEQILSNIVFKRLLITAMPTMVRGKFVDHQMVDPINKIDCGPLWPLDTLNDLVFSWKDATQLNSLNATVLTKDGVDSFNTEVKSLLGS